MSEDQAPDAPMDPVESLRILGADAARVRRRIEPDGRVLFSAWGAAWVIGYLTLWSTVRTGDVVPPAWAFVVYGGVLFCAIVITAVHIARRSAGLRGASAVSGAMYGWSWAVCFFVVGVILSSVAQADVPDELMGLLANAISCLVVGALYMAGAAIYREWSQFVLGVWIAVIGGIATVAGMPAAYLIMGIAGGGGMLAGALVSHLARSRDTSSTLADR